MEPVALICSVPLEAEPLLDTLEKQRNLEVGRRPAYSGRFGDTEVLLIVGGMGKTNAAHALTATLERFAVRGVLGFGVGGAYPGTGLEVGDIALASSQHYGDEGVETPDGWMGCEGIGLPLLEVDGVGYYNDFPVDRAGTGRIASALPEIALGHFVTVSCCSGTDARGTRLRDRFNAICETMEGAAYAHVAAAYETAYVELRGISNVVEDRDRSRWQLHAAAHATAHALPTALSVWPLDARSDAAATTKLPVAENGS